MIITGVHGRLKKEPLKPLQGFFPRCKLVFFGQRQMFSQYCSGSIWSLARDKVETWWGRCDLRVRLSIWLLVSTSVESNSSSKARLEGDNQHSPNNNKQAERDTPRTTPVHTHAYTPLQPSLHHYFTLPLQQSESLVWFWVSGTFCPNLAPSGGWAEGKNVIEIKGRKEGARRKEDKVLTPFSTPAPPRTNQAEGDV